MGRSTNVDVIAQVARGLANFAKCETREVIQGLWMHSFCGNELCFNLLVLNVGIIAQTGHKTGRSLLMEDGALEWLIVNSKTTSESTRRHMELALCHLAQNGMLIVRFILAILLTSGN